MPEKPLEPQPPDPIAADEAAVLARSGETTDEKPLEPKPPELTLAEYESVVRVRERAEKDILWKYSFGGLVISAAVVAAAGFAYFSVTKMAEDKLGAAAQNFERELKLKNALLEEIVAAARKAMDEAHAQEVRTAVKQREIQDALTVAQTKIQEFAEQSENIKLNLKGAGVFLETVQANLAVIKTLTSSMTNLTQPMKTEIANATAAAANASDFVANSSFKVYIHYRPANTASVAMLQDARQALAKAGFDVQGPSPESDVRFPINGTGHRGPRVDYFVDPVGSAAQEDSTAKAAKRAAALLDIAANGRFGPFSAIKDSEPRYASKQTTILAVWF